MILVRRYKLSGRGRNKNLPYFFLFSGAFFFIVLIILIVLLSTDVLGNDPENGPETPSPSGTGAPLSDLMSFFNALRSKNIDVKNTVTVANSIPKKDYDKIRENRKVDERKDMYPLAQYV